MVNENQVVPRKGDVDRNGPAQEYIESMVPSSPARGTWIEIVTGADRRMERRSSPARGTWIEIRLGGNTGSILESSPARGTWIEISPAGPCSRCIPASSPARGTWIEITAWRWPRPWPPVVPRKGDVDRNKCLGYVSEDGVTVVPRKGDVDRNFDAGSGEIDETGRPPQGGRG